MYNRRIVLATSLLAPISLAATIPSNLIYRQALSLASDLPASWSYKGCFIDPMANRTLKKASRSTTDMTGTSCLTWCASRGFNIAGTEWSSECYCGYDLHVPTAADDADCSMPCAGAAGEACGGPQRISVYESSISNRPGTNPGVEGFPSLGCWSDAVSTRALSVWGVVEGGLTVAKCAAACASQGFGLSGVEYGQECWCDNELDPSSQPAAGDGDESGCNMPCTGAVAEFCGGWNRMNLYGVLPEASSSSTVRVTSTSTSTSQDVSVATTTYEDASATHSATSEASASPITSPAPDSTSTSIPIPTTPDDTSATQSAASDAEFSSSVSPVTSTSELISTPTPTSTSEVTPTVTPTSEDTSATQSAVSDSIPSSSNSELTATSTPTSTSQDAPVATPTSEDTSTTQPAASDSTPSSSPPSPSTASSISDLASTSTSTSTSEDITESATTSDGASVTQPAESETTSSSPSASTSDPAPESTLDPSTTPTSTPTSSPEGIFFL